MASQSLETASSLKDFFSFFCSFTHKNKKYMQWIVNWETYLNEYIFFPIERQKKNPARRPQYCFCLLISNWNKTIRQ